MVYIEKIVGLIILAVAIAINGIHQVREGHVGVYYRGGALLSGIVEPGWHTKLPFITRLETVQVTVQTDSISKVPCGTQGGVLIEFEKIEVVNSIKKDLVWETVKNYTVNYD